MRQIYRQGDVLLVPIDNVPDGTKKVRRRNGQLILAEGEATGHHHAIADTDAELVTSDQAAELYLLVHGTEPVELTHQEHDTIRVAPGKYEVIRQVEYTPEELRRVTD